ncbi:hypothetical protein Agub_g11966 [Astrephomene gubernaculifera]|uniref:Uncharacterized protein n=1 Tax=Astrephomene gubernaculifera TaxID=47775 RepID=A0AAD3HQA2_9CHLO|nr:hypothetical protein Agub_g11966 [Astrephomene gubernaculifera]
MLTCKHATPSSVRARGTYRCKIAVISRNLPSARQLPSATRGPEEPSSTSQTPGRQPLPLPSEPSSEQRPGSAGNQETLATQAAKWAAEVVASPLFYLVAGLAAIKLLSLTGLEDGVTIFLFAALPITALTALSKSSLGKQVQQQLESKLPELQARAEALRRAHQQARRRSPWCVRLATAVKPATDPWVVRDAERGTCIRH